MTAVSVLLGAVVGLSLGLTGGGGAVLAVPLLVYVLGVRPIDAVGVSLATVGATALVGAALGARRGLVEPRTGLVFAAAGILTAPLGAWLARQIPPSVLLAAFGALMLVIAARMWTKAAAPNETLRLDQLDARRGPACRRDARGELRFTSRCALLLAVVGLCTGVLTGLFGVGGGFIIVPALVAFTGIDIHRGVTTSLLIVALVSASGLAAHIFGGGYLPADVALRFTAGSLAGLAIGAWLVARMNRVALQRVFALVIVAIGLLVVAKSFL
jgi:uncharacterized membrane protein YfcA